MNKCIKCIDEKINRSFVYSQSISKIKINPLFRKSLFFLRHLQINLTTKYSSICEILIIENKK